MLCTFYQSIKSDVYHTDVILVTICRGGYYPPAGKRKSNNVGDGVLDVP